MVRIVNGCVVNDQQPDRPSSGENTNQISYGKWIEIMQTKGIGNLPHIKLLQKHEISPEQYLMLLFLMLLGGFNGVILSVVILVAYHFFGTPQTKVAPEPQESKPSDSVNLKKKKSNNTGNVHRLYS